MRINKLVLNNFSSFEGINEFDFSVSNDKNIILIGGQNGAGKTSLFSAIKVALYGPLAFGYVGANSHYTTKIKEFINTRAFQTEKVESSVVINVSIKVEREYCNYEISREWLYIKQKLDEIYTVKRDGVILSDQEISYFQNYLQGIIPPDLFDFFLFDGEDVGNIFSTSSYNNYVKNAMFTMCDMDVFEIVRKFTSGYISKANCEEVDDSDYRFVEEKVGCVTNELVELETNILAINTQRKKIDIQLEEIETAYKNAGGITSKEKEQMAIEYAKAEKIKQENTIQIKNFVEGLMPFFIVKGFANKISQQLDLEEKGEIFFYVQNKINKDVIKSAISKYGSVSDKAVDEVVESLLESFKPKGYSENINPIHDLSKEEIGRVNGVFSSLEDFDVKKMLELISEKQKASDKTAEINRRLKNSMPEDEVNLFTEKENSLLKQKEELTLNAYNLEKIYTNKKEELTQLELEKNKKYQLLVEGVQNKHVYELSAGISYVMSQLLLRKTNRLRENLESLTVKNLHNIYRKDNLITHIEIEDNFQFNLYQNVRYTERELLALINNIGYDEVSKLIGEKGAKELLTTYSVNSINELKGLLEKSPRTKYIDTYKRVELNRLSKGERQIFILSLYWAIIMISGQDIPFIIDTPYARIDANHRKEISEKFFPNISKQVVILSTDEEINEEYYKIIYPHISKEYLLTNDENANRTTVEKKYFFEVKK